MKALLNILWLGLKEIRSLLSDLVMVVFVVYAFTLAIYVQATGTSSEVNNASISFVDEDASALSKQIFNAFYPPRFKPPEQISATLRPAINRPSISCVSPERDPMVSPYLMGTRP